MKTSIRAFNKDGDFICAVTCAEGSSREERVQALKDKLTEEGYDLLIDFWYLDDKLKETKDGDIVIPLQSELGNLLSLDPGEKLFRFAKHEPGMKEPVEYLKYESELDEKEVDILLGEFIYAWNDLPKKSQAKFAKHLNKRLIKHGIDLESFDKIQEDEIKMFVPVTQEWVQSTNEPHSEDVSNGWIDSDGWPLPLDYNRWSDVMPTGLNEKQQPTEGMWAVPIKKYIEIYKSRKEESNGK
jgi:hypothetical protein